MSDPACLFVRDIGEIFSQVISEIGGEVRELIENGERLLARAVLPEFENVATGDRVQNGVALSYSETQLRLHPYIFRLVCSNGMIRPRVMMSRQIGDSVPRDPEKTIEIIQSGVQACTAPSVLLEAVERMQDLKNHPAELGLRILAMLPGLSRESASRLTDSVLDLILWHDDAQPTMYDVLNSITAFARDRSDRTEKWNLERFAGRVVLNQTNWLVPAASAEKPISIRDEIPVA